MRRVLVPAAAAVAVLALSLRPVSDLPASAPTVVRIADQAACHFLRVVPAPDVDPHFVVPARTGPLSGVMVPGPDGSRLGVPAAATPALAAPTPNGEVCHAAPPLLPLHRSAP